MIDNKNNPAELLDEEQLEQVSGGARRPKTTTRCFCKKCGVWSDIPGTHTKSIEMVCPACKYPGVLYPEGWKP